MTGVANISEKIREARLRWLGEHGSEWTNTEIGTPKLRWSDVIRKDMEKKQVFKKIEGQDQRTWRLKTPCADGK